MPAIDPTALPTSFVHRHIGPRASDVQAMLDTLSMASLDELSTQAVPDSIRMTEPLALGPPRSEADLLAELRAIAGRNTPFKEMIGLGYFGTVTPPVIQRNILENPGWYTQYTPYQAEISQGRLEALLNFQTMVADLCGLELANASLLDEATAAAEAMAMCRAITRGKKVRFFVAQDCHPQTIAVVRGRAEPLGIEIVVGDPATLDPAGQDLFGILLQYPTTDGRIEDYRALIEATHQAGALAVVATDLLALTLLAAPGELGADIAVGSSQRFGVPLGYGGPHAAFLATRESYRRQIPGRIVGVTRDARGHVAYRLALQTREQHIRRERATSNICTAQVLLAIIASMYAVYHGPEGLRAIATRVRSWAEILASGLRRLGYALPDKPIFDTVRVPLAAADQDRVLAFARSRKINLRVYEGGDLGVTVDETTRQSDVADVLDAFASAAPTPEAATHIDKLVAEAELADFPPALVRESDYLTHEVFHRYRSEHELLRYMRRLESRDLSLTTSMIPLGSCTMKLNATAEMFPITWPELAHLHPFAPSEQAHGYHQIFSQLEEALAELCGLPAVSLQPNSGAQGEYAGLLVIRAYHRERGDGDRNVCLIPTSAHGTNPASAVMAGMKVVPVACDERGNIDVADLRGKADKHRDHLAALMITYPSTHGVFETAIREICDVVHQAGGQVYMDGANMNAQLGLCRPGDYGADVCHLNLHKTFCIPHGGGGPGMGPIAVASHLAAFLPGHPFAPKQAPAIAPVAAAPFGSPSILPISWMYIRLMGAAGLTRATQVAILNANYIAARLRDAYPVLYSGENGLCAHEVIVDVRPFKKTAGIQVADVAKRLMDYGFHAPTMSWPVAGTLMIEPTESESKAELDRFCDAMIAIREEIRDIEEGRADRESNLLKNAPHTAQMIADDEWPYAYSRSQAAYPARHLREHKFWPYVARIDEAYGDRNLVCSCPPWSGDEVAQP